MKNKVNVVKKIAFLKGSRPWAALFAVVVLASLVVLSGCQGAVGPTGEAGKDGAIGPAGPTGPTGPAGAAPMAVPDISTTVYLALNGIDSPVPAHTANTAATTAGYNAKTVDLSTFFTDAESPTLSYTAVSTDVKIAETDATSKTNVVATGKLKITAKKAGTTPITVTAFDGVNDGVPITLTVIVAENNTPPIVSLTKTFEDRIGSKKLISSVALDIPFTAVVTPGVAGETETVKFRTVIDTGATTDTEYVSASVTGSDGSYILTVTRLLAGIKLEDESKTNDITIIATDDFGAETEVATLQAQANAPPRVKRDLPATVYLYRTGDKTLDVLKLTGKPMGTSITLTDFFAVEMDDPTTNIKEVDDTTCTFSTNPHQPTGFGAVDKVVDKEALAGTPAYPAVSADPITKATRATVSNGISVTVKNDRRAHYPTALSHAMSNGTFLAAKVVVNSKAIGEKISAAGTGTVTLTITCRDDEKSETSSTTVEVFG